MNVFVFPARNEVGLEAIQALSRSNKITLFAGSSYESQHDPARHLLKNYVLCPGYDEPGFESRFVKILRERNIDIVLPAWDKLVAVFSRWNVEGITFITPRAEIAELLLSKRATYERLAGVVPVPKIYSTQDPALPLFAKPDTASGSVGGILVEHKQQLDAAIAKGLLLSEYLPGREFTVDCISDREGKLLFCNPRVRGRIGQGIALGTEPVDDARVHENIARIAEALKIEGPWFAQFKENDRGEPVLLEINARIGGSSTLTRMCGVNIPLISVFMFSGHEVRIPRPQPVLLNRCMRNLVDTPPFDWVIWDWDDTLVRKDGKPDPDAVACMVDLNNRGVRQLLLSKNAAAPALMEKYRIPDFFVEKLCAEDKVSAIAALVQRHGIEFARCIMINDSYTETFAIQERYPMLRTLTPDALEVLGREPI
ncbi:MAG: ATP-grasp domain-containing protein [Candidatus Hydrogenedentes bacterium]|nr:ATP-grasp domain-containing protein [Candidatus Hydrogenedentota bacterium]